MGDLSAIFKAYDIRGKVGTELTADLARDIGKALADWLPTKGAVAVGRDMRPDSAELAGALIKGLRAQGRDVWDIGEVTSDMVYFAVGHYSLAGGAVITASHNPGDYNGIKLCREAAKPVGQDTGLFEIRDKVLNNKTNTKKLSAGSVISKDVTNQWISHVLSFIDTKSLKPLTIAVDAGNGMAGKIYPFLEQHLPFKTHEMYFELDGTFPNHIANPLEPKNLVDLQHAIKEYGCDAGVAFDGDGDRAVLVDETGVPLAGTVVTALLAEYFLKKQPGSTILINAICGQAAVDAIEKAGGNYKRTRVGHSFIKQDMRKNNAIFAGEHSGHYYFEDNYMADSGLIAAVVALSILSTSGKKLSELVKEYRSSYVQIPETNFEVEDKDVLIKQVEKHFKGKEGARINHLDGLTVTFGDAWFNIRPSNTEPLLRLNAEAANHQVLKRIVNEVKKQLTG